MKYNHELKANLQAVCDTNTDATENDRLYHLLVDGDESAKEQMIVNNLPLAASCAASYVARHQEYSHLQDDLIGEGFLAIVNAVNTIHQRTNNGNGRITSYIIKCIHRHINRFIDKSPLIPASARALRRARRDKTAYPAIPKVTATKDVTRAKLNTSAEPIGVVELRDTIDSCCLSAEDRAIVAMRQRGSTFQEIAATLGLSCNTTHRMYLEIQHRFDAKMKELQQ
jgi:RNA polymerase sigma factor (sigma-70 family)